MAPDPEVIENPVVGMRLRLLRTAADTDGELLEMEATYEPGSVEPVEHFHPHQAEEFEIVSGRMRARVDGEERDLRTGDRLHIPPKTVHAMWNEGDSKARVMWWTRPALRTEEFFATTSRLAREGRLSSKGARTPLLGAVLLREFRNEFRPVRPPAAVQALVLPAVAGLGRLLGQRL